MLLTSHDLYDLHTVFVHIRNAPDSKESYAVTVRLLDLFTKWDFDPMIGGNIIRRALRPASELDRERWYWLDTDNVYAYPGRIFNPDHPIYPMLRAAFEAIFSRLKAEDFENAGMVADAFHNIPLILAQHDTRGCRRRVAGELTRARKLYGRAFLREELERLPR